MTKSIYEQLKKDPRFTIASKVWYNEYPFRISFKHWDMFDGDYLNNFHRNSNIKKSIKNLGHDIRYRSDVKFNIYLKNTDALEDVVRLYNKEIVNIYGPVSKDHHDMMIQDLSQSVRKKFFYNRYRYKVSCKLYRYKDDMDQLIDIADFVTSSFDPDTYYLNSTIKSYARLKAIEEDMKQNYNYRYSRYFPYGLTGSVYLTQYEDVCTMHLMFKNIITSTTKVVLIEELE